LASWWVLGQAFTIAKRNQKGYQLLTEFGNKSLKKFQRSPLLAFFNIKDAEREFDKRIDFGIR
jgi:hypothetical protein